MSIRECVELGFPTITDVRGDLTFIEAFKHLPFEIRRVYYLTRVPVGEGRGGHAHLNLEQVLIALGGSFDVVIDDGFERATRPLSSPSKGLYLCSGIWRELSNFSPDAICLVLASEEYMEDDYIRSYDRFLSIYNAK